MNTHLFSNNNLSERGLLKLINSSTVEKRNLLQPLKEGEKKKKQIFDYRHRFEESEIVEHLVFGEAARDELKVMADFWMQAGRRKGAFGDPHGRLGNHGSPNCG